MPTELKRRGVAFMAAVTSPVIAVRLFQGIINELLRLVRLGLIDDPQFYPGFAWREFSCRAAQKLIPHLGFDISLSEQARHVADNHGIGMGKHELHRLRISVADDQVTVALLRPAPVR